MRIPDRRKGKLLQFGIRLLAIWAIEVVGLPFLMFPSALPAPKGSIVGAASLHAVLKNWAGGQA